jgi:hypothetical protein
MTHILDLDLLLLKLDSQLLQLDSISKTEPHTAIFNTTTPLHISTSVRLAQALTAVAKANSLSVSLTTIYKFEDGLYIRNKYSPNQNKAQILLVEIDKNLQSWVRTSVQLLLLRP